jgi:hypothetical protein
MAEVSIEQYCFGIFKANPKAPLVVIETTIPGRSPTRSNDNQNNLIKNVKALQGEDHRRPIGTVPGSIPLDYTYTVQIPVTGVWYRCMPIGSAYIVFTKPDGSIEFSTNPIYVLAPSYNDAVYAISKYGAYTRPGLQSFPIKYDASGLVVGAPFTHTGQIAAFLWMKATSAPDGTMAVVHGQRIYNCRDSAGAVIIRCYSPDGQKIGPPAYVVAHSVEEVLAAMRA